MQKATTVLVDFHLANLALEVQRFHLHCDHQSWTLAAECLAYVGWQAAGLARAWYEGRRETAPQWVLRAPFWVAQRLAREVRSAVALAELGAP